MRQANLYPLCGLLFLLVVVLATACHKSDSETNNPRGNNNNPPAAGSVNADTLSAHLRFHAANRKQGKPPAAPLGSASLKISFQDTLYLTDEVLKPIKFLHQDTTKNVAGVYIQVQAGGGGSFAASYFDVPEVSNMADSDTVSVITIGIDPAGIEAPQSAGIKITPYDENRQPLAEIVRPLKIVERKVDLPSSGSAGTCGLTLPSGKVWVWMASFILGNGTTDTGHFKFWSEPHKVWSPQGQYIEGSCCNGNSKYPEYCPGGGASKHNSRLHFATYYSINFETFLFFGNGNFFRQTMEDAPVPLPAESNFCAPNGAGKVKASLKHTTYDGTYTVTQAKHPPNAPGWAKYDSLQLNLVTTTSSGTGYGNPGGVIHQLDCKIGALMLVQLDSGGGGRHLFKLYTSKNTGEYPWYNF